MSNLQIRAASLDDADTIFQVHKDSVERLCTGHYSPEQIAMWLDGRSPQTYTQAILGGNLWLAQNDEVQGFVEVEGHEVSKLFIRGSGARQGIGKLLLLTAPKLMRLLTIVGTAAMFMVGGNILVHGVEALAHMSHAAEVWAKTVPGVGGVLAPIATTLFDAVIGLIAGALVLLVVMGAKRIFKRKA